jgi:hypothetical protein
MTTFKTSSSGQIRPRYLWISSRHRLISVMYPSSVAMRSNGDILAGTRRCGRRDSERVGVLESRSASRRLYPGLVPFRVAR